MCSESPCWTAVSQIYKCTDIHTELYVQSEWRGSEQWRNVIYRPTRKDSLPARCKQTVFNIHKSFSLTWFSPFTLLIHRISTTEMTQISNTNSPLLSDWSQGERSYLRAVRHDSAAMPTAARPIPLQYASPPVDLVRMLFIVPQTNRIADEHLNYTASLSS